MRLERICLRDFRNYKTLSLPLSAGLNVFWGANAQGKTNLLETVVCAALGRSHRAAKDAEMVRWDCDSAYMALDFERLGAKNRLELYFSREKRRKVLRNGMTIPLRDLIGTLNAVLFSPEDLSLVKGSPQGRRRFLDAEISQGSSAYYHALLQYHRLLNQRNALLKNIRGRLDATSLLAPWDAQLAKGAAYIATARRKATAKISHYAVRMQKYLTGGAEQLSLVYTVHGEAEGWPLAQNLETWYNNKLKERQSLDMMRGVTSVGPQRDDVQVLLDGRSLKSYGSQGQQRTGVLSLKLAELAFLRAETGAYPILLLDDVLSELDKARQKALLAFVQKEQVQTLVTTTEKTPFPPEATFYQVEKGTIICTGNGR